MKILDFALRPTDIINEKLLCVHMNFFEKKFILRQNRANSKFKIFHSSHPLVLCKLCAAWTSATFTTASESCLCLSSFNCCCHPDNQPISYPPWKCHILEIHCLQMHKIKCDIFLGI